MQLTQDRGAAAVLVLYPGSTAAVLRAARLLVLRLWHEYIRGTPAAGGLHTYSYFAPPYLGMHMPSGLRALLVRMSLSHRQLREYMSSVCAVRYRSPGRPCSTSAVVVGPKTACAQTPYAGFAGGGWPPWAGPFGTNLDQPLLSSRPTANGRVAQGSKWVDASRLCAALQ